MRTAIFPGSFDPFTLGHLDVLNSAIKLFDKIIIAVGYNHQKKGFLSTEDRIDLIKSSISDLKDCGTILEVTSYTGLTVEFCRQSKAEFIIRGLRTTTDFEMESVIAQANKKMYPDIVTVFIPASHQFSFISSTVVRDIIINGGDASAFLPKGVNIKNYIK